ncbi:protein DETOXIFICATION 43-like [Vicia villosa]|uniref:protein DETOXIFICATION 43-like n=1 Tax=Vicia villosa TaxID=3911 RepID=UPI00273ADF99|nr:protein DETOXIFICATION 43-like [Vicia villosa]XP_058768735.1 protein DETOXIFICATION 43-like [Vicia villosa]XP_058768736.1 protein DETOXIFICATION 43-like [Vicia villosa]
MDDNGIANNNAVKNKWLMPLSVFFKDASLVFKMDTLAKEILGIAFPSALAVAADPIASLIDTAFIGHLGPVELAAAGVSIAVFNQASRITIFPLVSITTSFVAEEDTINKINSIAAEKQSNESIKAKTNGVIPDDHLLQDIEAGATKQDGTLKNETKNGDDANLNTSKSSIVTSNGNKSESKPIRKKRHIASASTALLFGTVLGLIQAATLIFAAKPLLGAMGLKSDSPMMTPATKYLRLRALGAPAVLLSLAMQGIFRGFKDTTTPLFVIVSGYTLNVALDPLLIFYFKMGIRGAAISHVLSQYIMATLLLFILMRKVDLVPPSMKDLQIFRFLKNGGLLLARVIAVTFCVTLSASLAARLGPIPMAAFQTCLQVWMTSSLLADGLAVAIQAILACSFAEKDYVKVTTAATRTLQMSFVLGVGLSLLVGGGLYFGAGVFSKDVAVIHLIRLGLPFVAATQPINSLAFVFDGVNYGASDFAYSAYSLVLVSLASVTSLFFLYKTKGFIGIWIALTIYMSLRMFAGVWRMGTGTGPWRFLRGHSLS